MRRGNPPAFPDPLAAPIGYAASTLWAQSRRYNGKVVTVEGVVGPISNTHFRRKVYSSIWLSEPQGTSMRVGITHIKLDSGGLVERGLCKGYRQVRCEGQGLWDPSGPSFEKDSGEGQRTVVERLVVRSCSAAVNACASRIDDFLFLGERRERPGKPASLWNVASQHQGRLTMGTYLPPGVCDAEVKAANDAKEAMDEAYENFLAAKANVEAGMWGSGAGVLTIIGCAFAVTGIGAVICVGGGGAAVVSGGLWTASGVPALKDAREDLKNAIEKAEEAEKAERKTMRREHVHQ